MFVTKEWRALPPPPRLGSAVNITAVTMTDLQYVFRLKPVEQREA